MTTAYTDTDILTAMQGQKPLIAREVAELIKGNEQHVRKRLDALAATGQVHRKKVKRRIGGHVGMGRTAIVTLYSVAAGIAVEGVG